MTLDEAIKHAEQVADDHDKIKKIKAVTEYECQCAAEHRQLAKWLRELKAYRQMYQVICDADIPSSTVPEHRKRNADNNLRALSSTKEALKALEALDRIFNFCEEIDLHLSEDDPDRTGYQMLPDIQLIRECLLYGGSPDEEGK